MHICAHVEMLLKYIKKYSDDCKISISSYERSANLKIMLVQHQKLLNLVRTVDSIYSNVSFSQLLCSNIIICLSGFVIMTVGNI